MKYLIFILGIVLVFSSCTDTPQEKAEKTIKEWMKKNLKDPSSYESISFSELDSITSVEKLNEYQNLNSKVDKLIQDRNITVNRINEMNANYPNGYSQYEYDKLQKTIPEIDKELDEINTNIKRLEESFTQRYLLIHRYRAKNGFGALDFGEVTFYLDTDLNYIIETETIK